VRPQGERAAAARGVLQAQHLTDRSLSARALAAAPAAAPDLDPPAGPQLRCPSWPPWLTTWQEERVAPGGAEAGIGRGQQEEEVTGCQGQGRRHRPPHPASSPRNTAVHQHQHQHQDQHQHPPRAWMPPVASRRLRLAGGRGGAAAPVHPRCLVSVAHALQATGHSAPPTFSSLLDLATQALQAAFPAIRN